MRRKEGIYMEMLGNRRTQGAAASFDQKRVRIINIMLKYGVKEMAATALATFLQRDQLPV
jgi:hypothetical protein